MVFVLHRLWLHKQNLLSLGSTRQTSHLVFVCKGKSIQLFFHTWVNDCTRFRLRIRFAVMKTRHLGEPRANFFLDLVLRDVMTPIELLGVGPWTATNICVLLLYILVTTCNFWSFSVTSDKTDLRRGNRKANSSPGNGRGVNRLPTF